MNINLKQELSETNHISWAFFPGIAFIALLPLVSAFPLFTPPAWGQTMLFRTVFLFLLAFFIFYHYTSSQISPKKMFFSFREYARLPFWGLFSFLGFLLLATVFSLDPHFSFWGTPYRAWGTLNYILYAAFALMLLFTLTQKGWQRLWQILITTGVIASLIAFAQYFQLFGEYLVGDTRRPPSTFGNALFLAIFLAMLLPFLAESFIRASNRIHKIYIGLTFLLFALVIVISETRAVFIALAISGAFFFILHPQNKRIFKMGGILAVSFVAILLILLNTITPPATLAEQSNLTYNLWQRLSIKNIVQEEPRFAAWPYALQAIQDRPLLGYGPYNSSIAFDKYFNASDARFQGRTTGWWDTFHNMYFDIAVGSGILGIGAFLFFVCSLMWSLWTRRNISPKYRHTIHIIQASFLIYFVSMLFSFNAFATYLLFFVLISYSFSFLKKSIHES